jgi:hypothetical protein
MSKSRHALMSLPHRIGVAGPAYSRAFRGTSAPKLSQGIRAPIITARRLNLALLTTLLILTGGLLFSGTALASTPHALLGSFGEPCTTTPCGDGQFNEPSGVAVNDSTDPLTEPAAGDVYVVDKGDDRVEVFDSEGTYLSQFNGSAALTGEFSSPEAIAVDDSINLMDPSANDVYVADVGHSVIDKFSSSGAYEGQLTGTCASPGTCSGSVIPFFELRGVAVDPEGNVWVYDSEGNVDEFSDEGSFVKTFNTNRSVGPGLAVNSSDDVFALCGCESVLKFNSTGEELAEFAESSSALAFDPATNNPFVARLGGLGIIEYTSTPLPVETFGAGQLSESYGLAVNSASGTVYASQREANNVEIFINEPETGSASGLTETSATLNGIVPPYGISVSACEFEYGTEAGVYSHTIGCAQSTPFSSDEPVPVSANLGGLAPGTVYHYRLRVAIGTGEAHGQEQTFTTPVPPTVAEESVTSAASTSATFEAQVDPGGADTAYRVEYGTTPSYGASVPVPEGGAGSGIAAIAVSVQAQGLRPSTTYHYRFVVGNAARQGVAGPDQTFTTQGPGGTLTLPDGRAWEMVSPAQKLGAQVTLTQQSLMQASEDGSAISYPMSAPFSASQAGNVRLSQALSRRGSGGWLTEDIATPYTKPTLVGERFGEYSLFSADLSYALVEPFGDNPLAPGGEKGSIYVRDDSTGTYTLLTGSEGQWYEEMVKRPSDEAVEHESGPETCVTSTDPANGSPVVGESDYGCIAYFVSSAVLASGGSSGAHNLYVAAGDSAGAWTVSFIATLSAGDEPDWQPTDVGGELQVGTQTVEVSPDGRYLAFMSDRSLTGYDNRDANSGEPDEEVYRFHYEPGAPAGGSLVCASCDPTGARPAGWLLQRGSMSDEAFDGKPWTGRWVAATIPGPTEVATGVGLYEPRYMLDNGRLFFDSHDALVPQDINGVGDVYEYEPGGEGGCPAASSGCVALLSGGTGPRESAFADASASGNDVFFVTADKLIPRDVGNEYDMYDAHVCGAEVPCPTSVVAPPPCTTADSCKPAQAAQPGVFGPSGSATFSGAGNSAGGRESSPPVVKPVVKSLTKAQKLAKALKACRKKPKKKRASCQKQARKTYGASKAKKSAKGRK